jgi:hypothetical protein
VPQLPGQTGADESNMLLAQIIDSELKIPEIMEYHYQPSNLQSDLKKDLINGGVISAIKLPLRAGITPSVP